ncbi:MAG: hypothetical protein AAFQ82_21070 [Myxococcota bacterium]
MPLTSIPPRQLLRDPIAPTNVEPAVEVSRPEESDLLIRTQAPAEPTPGAPLSPLALPQGQRPPEGMTVQQFEDRIAEIQGPDFILSDAAREDFATLTRTERTMLRGTLSKPTVATLNSPVRTI